MNQSQSQSQGQSQAKSQGEAPAQTQAEGDVTGRQSPGGESAAQSSSEENAKWASETKTECSDNSSHTPAGYGDRGQGGQPEDALPPQAEQPGRAESAPDSELARQAGEAERENEAFSGE